MVAIKSDMGNPAIAASARRGLFAAMGNNRRSFRSPDANTVMS